MASLKSRSTAAQFTVVQGVHHSLSLPMAQQPLATRPATCCCSATTSTSSVQHDNRASTTSLLHPQRIKNPFIAFLYSALGPHCLHKKSRHPLETQPDGLHVFSAHPSNLLRVRARGTPTYPLSPESTSTHNLPPCADCQQCCQPPRAVLSTRATIRISRSTGPNVLPQH